MYRQQGSLGSGSWFSLNGYTLLIFKLFCGTKPPPKWKSLCFYIYKPVLSGVPHKEGPSQTLWNLVEGAIRESVWKEILQQERSPTMWNLVLHLGNLGYIFGRIFVLPNIVGRTHCQQSLIHQICLKFDVWHMNFNNDMTSMRKIIFYAFILSQLAAVGGYRMTNRVFRGTRQLHLRVSATCKLHQRTILAPYLGAGKPAIPPDGIHSQIPAESRWRQTLMAVLWSTDANSQQPHCTKTCPQDHNPVINAYVLNLNQGHQTRSHLLLRKN